MNGTEAKQLFIKHALPTIEAWGFKEEKNRTTVAFFIRQKKNSFERISVTTYNYSPEVIFTFGLFKYIYKIEEILAGINETYSLNFKIGKETYSAIYWGNNRNEQEIRLSGVSNKDTEQGVIDSSKIILEYLEKEALPLFELFDDLRELDKRINGEGENFWITDSGNARPFHLGQFFDERRLIIAWLCSNPRFDEIVDRTFTFLEKSTEEYTGKPYVYNRNDLTKRIPATVRYLQDNVKPL